MVTGFTANFADTLKNPVRYRGNKVFYTPFLK
jgi:hypothetical protein